MQTTIFKFRRRRKGGTVITMIGIAGAICLFGLLFLELQTMYNYQYAIEVRAQRALNSCVEYAMDDRWRSDGYNYMDIDKAKNNLMRFLHEDLDVDNSGRCLNASGDVAYVLVFGTPVYHSGNPHKYCAGCRAYGCRTSAGIKIQITVTMHAGMAKFYKVTNLQNGYTWTNEYASTNFRTDGNERAGT